MKSHNERDWPEDFSHESGRYKNKCVLCNEIFYGHKRRVACKKCMTEVTRKRTSVEWCKHYNVELGRDIIDPDGWDRQNFQQSFFEEEITVEEFNRRVGLSTINFSAFLDENNNWIIHQEREQPVEKQLEEIQDRYQVPLEVREDMSEEERNKQHAGHGCMWEYPNRDIPISVTEEDLRFLLKEAGRAKLLGEKFKHQFHPDYSYSEANFCSRCGLHEKDTIHTTK